MAQSFFTFNKDNPIKYEDKNHNNCKRCKLFQSCSSPDLKIIGKGEKEILIVTGIVSPTEDESGVPLAGTSGTYLRAIFNEEGISVKKDCWYVNAVRCMSTADKPTDSQITLCRHKLIKDIQDIKPKLVILMGTIACASFLKDIWGSNIGSINRWEGSIIPIYKYNTWALFTYDPIKVLTAKGDMIEEIMRRSLKKGLKYINKKVPAEPDYSNAITKLTNPDKINVYLEDLFNRKPKEIAFDYETTGLKPHNKAHKIVSCAISEDDSTATSFLMYLQIKDNLKRILSCPDIGKIATNMKYEHNWTKTKLGIDVENWIWDTMLISHILDNRRQITGLKFQAFVNFGVVGYDKGIDYYFGYDDDSKGTNSINRINKINTNKLLTYNGMDSLLEFKLAKLQMRQMKKFERLL